MAWTPSVTFDLKDEDVKRLRPPVPPVPMGGVVTAPQKTAAARTEAPPPPMFAPPAQPATTSKAGAPLSPVPTTQTMGAVTVPQTTNVPAPAQPTAVNYQQPPPTPAPVETPAPLAAQPAPQAPTQITAQPLQATPTTLPATPATPTAPVTPAAPAVAATPPEGDFNSSLADFQKQAKDWMAGTENPAVRTALNRSLDLVGLQNQAQMDALRMQINQDPTLRGQGAGVALLAMMARDQNFKVDDLIGQMSERNLERIVEMQKYGFEAGVQLEGKQFQRNQDLAQTLIAAGDYAGAAALLQKNAESIAPGMGFNITPESLKNRDPYEIERLNSMISLVKDLAKTDPKAATALLNSMMANNPMLKAWLPEGITADQMISTLTTGGSAANSGAANTIRRDIRTAIVDDSDYGSVETRLADLFKLENRDAVKEGTALTLDRINEIRKLEGLDPITDKAELDDIDYKELGYKNEFYRMKSKADEQPWQPLYDMIMQSPDAAKFLDPSLFPGGADAVKNFVISYSTGLVSFDYDPETGTFVPSASEFTVPWDNPALYPMFYHMPLATFNPDGSVNGSYSVGGTSFSESSPKTADEERLQQQYAAYVQSTKTSGGTALSAPQWYFATAGGTKPPNTANIPKELLTGTRADPNAPTNVGGPGTAEAFDPDKFIADFSKLTSDTLKTSLSDATFVANAFKTDAVTDAKFWEAAISNNGITINNRNFGFPVVNGKPKLLRWNYSGVGPGVELSEGGKRLFLVLEGENKGYTYLLNSRGSIEGTNSRSILIPA